MNNITIDKHAKQITFINNGIGFSQFGVAKEILDLIENQVKETERLNNIINEIEKYLIEEIEDYDKHINSQYITDNVREQYEGEKVCFEDMLGKLQELKGSDE